MSVLVSLLVFFLEAIPAGSGEAGGRVAEGTTRCNGGAVQETRGNVVWFRDFYKLQPLYINIVIDSDFTYFL